MISARGGRTLIRIVLVGGVAVAGVGAVVVLDLPVMRDETYHWPTTVLFGGGLPSLRRLATYYAGPGPLSYVIWGNLYALGVGLPLLRATSWLAAIIATIGLLKTARTLRAPLLALPIAFILVQPYILTNAFLLMTDSFALALAAWALYFIAKAFDEGRWSQWAGAAVLSAMLLYVRIPYIAIPGGLAIASVTGVRFRRASVATAAVTIASVLPLVALWGGVQTPVHNVVQQAHRLTFHASHLTYLLAWLGFFLWPYLLTRTKWRLSGGPALAAFSAVAAAVVAAGLIAGKQGAVAGPSMALKSAGVVTNLVVGVGERISPDSSLYPLIALSIVGLGVVFHIAAGSWASPIRRVMLFIAVCAAGLPMVSAYWWERHAIPAYVLVALLAWSEPSQNRWLAWGWLFLLATLAIAHMIHVFVFLG